MCDGNVDTKILVESPVFGETPSLHVRTSISFQVQKGLVTSKWIVSLEKGSQPKLLKNCSLYYKISLAVIQGQYPIKDHCKISMCWKTNPFF